MEVVLRKVKDRVVVENPSDLRSVKPAVCVNLGMSGAPKAALASHTPLTRGPRRSKHDGEGEGDGSVETNTVELKPSHNPQNRERPTFGFRTLTRLSSAMMRDSWWQAGEAFFS